MPTDTTVNNLIINKLTKAQYDAINNPSETELYLVPDEIDSAPVEGSTNPVESGGVYSALAGKQDTITGAASTITSTNLTINRALISNGSGKVAISSVTSTELSYLSGATSNIQTQLNSKQDALVSGTNIKTINNESLLGEGNITIESGEDNIIESITVNGTTQTPSNKNIALTIPSAVTESTVAGWGFTKNTGTLTSETDPVFSASAAAGITAGNISAWNSYQANIIESITVNGATQTITNKNIALTISYSLTVDGFEDTYYDLIDNSITNDDLLLEVGDTFEAAFAKLQRTILDNEEVSSAAMINLNSRITTLENDNSSITTETDPIFTASAAAGITSGNISAWNSYQANVIESITVNGATQTITNKNAELSIPLTLSEYYDKSNLSNDALLLEAGDSFETAFSKLEKSVSDKSIITSEALIDLNSKIITIENELYNNLSFKILSSETNVLEPGADDYYIDGNNVSDPVEAKELLEKNGWLIRDGILYYLIKTDSTSSNYIYYYVATFDIDQQKIKIAKLNWQVSYSRFGIRDWYSFSVGGEANVIESITVNGTTQTPSNKNIALTIPSAVTESTVAGWGFTKNTGTLTSETDPVFSASAAAGITAGNITAWNSYQANVIESITVNGTTQTPTNKNIALTIPSTNGLATTQYVDTAVAGIVNSAPETLDTLNELAAALGNDPNFATTISNQIGTKVSKTELSGLGYLQSETDPVFSASAAAGITAGNITAWNTYQANKIESITVNGTTQTPSNKNIALTIPSAVTESTVAGWGFTKNTGTLTSETDPVFSASAAHGITAGNISAWNSYQANVIEAVTFNGATATVTNKVVQITAPVIPNYSSADAGKILSVNSSGQLVWVTPVNIYSGNTTPNNSQGNNGDIYLQI